MLSSSSSSSYQQQTLNCKASTRFHVNGDNILFDDNMYPLSKNDLQRIFEKLDKNGDGLLSLEELNWLVQRIGSIQLSVEELEPLVGKPCLNFDEFLFFYDSISNRPTAASSGDDERGEEESTVDSGDVDDDGDLVEAFKVFDLNGDGYISCEELENVLGRLGLWDEKSGKDCRKMIWFYDTNLDGMVDFQEFKNMIMTIS